jgi:hypothetical protein
MTDPIGNEAKAGFGFRHWGPMLVQKNALRQRHF